MKAEDFLLLAAGVVAAYVVFRSLRGNKAAAAGAPAGATPGILGSDTRYTRTITQYDGWQYFDDGTAIAPNGDYYFQGKLIWKAQP